MSRWVFTAGLGAVRCRRHLGDLPTPPPSPKGAEPGLKPGVGSEVPAGFPGGRGPPPLGAPPPPREQRGNESSRLPPKLAWPPGFRWASQKQSPFSGPGLCFQVTRGDGKSGLFEFPSLIGDLLLGSHTLMPVRGFCVVSWTRPVLHPRHFLG